MGGWNATSALSCNSTLGPRPLAGTAPATVRNGSAGPAMSPKKNAATTRVTSVAHADEGVGGPGAGTATPWPRCTRRG